MTAPGVVGVTFPEANEEKVKQPVLASKGVVTSLPAWVKQSDGSYRCGLGVIEGIQKLADNKFFDSMSGHVRSVCQTFLKK
jgi:hypothetical protein